MLKKLFNKYGFYIITTVVLCSVFFGGFFLGLYGKAAPSLEAIEQEQYRQKKQQEQQQSEMQTISEEPIKSKAEKETAESEEETTEIEEEQDNEITVVATAYCPCDECSEGYGAMTATGVKAQAGRTIAVDPSVIPYGTYVYLEDNEQTYVAEDCGGAINGNEIDIFFNTHAEVTEFGRREMTAFILN